MFIVMLSIVRRRELIIVIRQCVVIIIGRFSLSLLFAQIVLFIKLLFVDVCTFYTSPFLAIKF